MYTNKNQKVPANNNWQFKKPNRRTAVKWRNWNNGDTCITVERNDRGEKLVSFRWDNLNSLIYFWNKNRKRACTYVVSAN